MRHAESAAFCNAMVAPGLRCGHRIEEHVFHGAWVLECWQCEDWHLFLPMRQRAPGENRRAARWLPLPLQ